MVDVTRAVVGVFKGFSESGLEFKAEIVAPYNSEYSPVLGSFLLVSISPEDYLLGRITNFYPVGVMSGAEAEDYLARLMKTGRTVPEDIKEAKLRYNVQVKLLGGLSMGVDGAIQYRPSIRQLPHLGAFVASPNEQAIRFICSLGVESGEKPALLGHLSMGDVIYDGSNGNRSYPVGFDVRRLVGRRTYVFAHAGYGKTNLIKHMVTQLYEGNPNVGFLIFDPEGEYAFEDKKGRPGLADIAELRDKIVVYTDRHVPEKYGSVIGGDVHFSLAVFAPGEVIATCVVPDKWEQVWANVVRGLASNEWAALIGELGTSGFRTETGRIIEIIHTQERTAPQAILNNLVPVIRRLHRDTSRMMEGIIWHLQKGHIVIVDISLMSSIHGRWVASLILADIFHRNQSNFIAGTEGELLNAVAVVEEAQTVLSGRRDERENIFVQWAKEGRKYNLGGIFVTQQPGAISSELLSQGENFFVFHLLSAQDLFSLKNANAHFSEDILTVLLNEPIPGNAYFWSAPYQPFVLPLKVVNFEEFAKRESKKSSAAAGRTPAEEFAGILPDLEKEVDSVIRNSIEMDKRVPLYPEVSVVGEDRKGLVAVKLWNLKFCIAETLSAAAGQLYTVGMSDGKRTILDKVLDDSLRRQGLTYRLLRLDGSQYLVFDPDQIKVGKPVKHEPLAFGQQIEQIQ